MATVRPLSGGGADEPAVRPLSSPTPSPTAVRDLSGTSAPAVRDLGVSQGGVTRDLSAGTPTQQQTRDLVQAVAATGLPGAVGQAPSEQGNLFENIIGGVGGFAKGITDMFGAGVHDTAALVTRLTTPGIDFGIEDDPAQFAGMLDQAFGFGPGPSSLRLHYQKYYGPLVKGDLKQFGENVYNDPVALILDAVTVGDLAALPARGAASIAARTGAEAPGWARTILGPGSREIMSSTAFGSRTLKLSSNPVIRGAQNFKNWAVTQPIDNLSTMYPEGSEGYALAQANLRAARENNVARMYRPTLSRELEMRQVRALDGLRRSLQKERAGQALSELNSKYMFGMYGRKRMNAMAHEIIDAIEGSSAPPARGNGAVQGLDIPKQLAPDHGLTPSDLLPGEGLDILKALSDEFDPRRPFGQGAVRAPKAGGNVFQVELGSPLDAVTMGERAAKALGGEFLGIDNLFAQNLAEKGIHAFIKLPDGKVVRVSFGTPKFFRGETKFYTIMHDVTTRLRPALREAQRELDQAVAAGDDVAIYKAARDVEWYHKEIAAAEAHAPSAFEGAVREVREALGEPYPDAWKVADEWGVWNHQWNAAPMVDTGQLTYQTIMNRTYGPQRLASFMEQMADLEGALRRHFDRVGTGPEAVPTVLDALSNMPQDARLAIMENGWRTANSRVAARDIVDKLRTVLREGVINGDWPGFDWREMHAARMEAGLSAPQYFAHKLEPASALAKRGRGGGVSIKPNVPGALTHQWAGWLMEDGRLVTDPLEVANRTFQEINVHLQAVEHSDRVFKAFGRRVPDAEVEVARYVHNGPEVYVNPAQAKAQLGIRMRLAQATSEYLQQGMGVLEATKKAIESEMPNIMKDMVQASTGEVYALPRHIAKELSKDLNRMTGWKARVFWENPTSLWRAAVLSFSPRWILRNTIGNITFQAIEDPRALYYSIRQLSRKQRKFMEYAIGTERLSEIESGFIHNLPGGRYFRGADDIAESAPGFAKAGEWINDTHLAHGLRRWSVRTRKINSYIEEAFRRGSYLSEAQRGLVKASVNKFGKSRSLLERLAREGITEGTHSAAVKAVNDTLGNYTNLTPAEQQVFRGIIAPFYPFYRHVARFVLRMPFKHPLLSQTLAHIDRLDEDMEAVMPEWLQGSVVVGQLGDGQSLFLNPSTSNPLDVVTNENGLTSLLHPAIKIAIERFAAGKSLFTGKEFYDQNVVEAPDGSKWYIVRDEYGRVLSSTPVEGEVLPSWFEHVASQFPQYTMAQDILAAVGPGYGAQASANGKVITENGVPVFPKPAWSIFTNYLGIPLYPYSIEDIIKDKQEAQEYAESVAEGRMP